MKENSSWIVVQCEEFTEEFKTFPPDLQEEILAQQGLLSTFGPNLGHPWVDTIKGSSLSNLKELRFSWNKKPYRFFFAFDPFRKAVVLVGGSKAGNKRFHDRFIPIAEALYLRYLEKEDSLWALSHTKKS